MKRRRRHAVGLGLALLVASGAAANSGVPHEDALPDPSAVPLAHRDLILQGLRHGFEGDLAAANRVWGEIRKRDPGHPAAPVFEVNTLYWMQMYDEDDTRWDDAILERSGEGIRLAVARLDDDPDDLEGHFYLGQALMHRGRIKGIRGRYLSAGTDGERARKHLERVLELRPDLVDGRYQVGLYYYYASLLPRIVSRWLGWLWFVPSGDGPTGLRYLNEVRTDGDLFRDDAAFILGNIYTYHEPQFHDRAVVLVHDLHERYPSNTLIHFELLEILFEIGDYAGSAEEARKLQTNSGRGGLERGRIDMARAWQARAELQLGDPETAWRTLSFFDDDGPERPYWGGAWVNLTRGRILDVLGERERAVVRYERVLAYRSPQGSRRASELARLALEEPFRLEQPVTMSPAESG